MLRGLYSAASALDAATQKQEVLSSNLAHVNTPGYRARSLTHETFDRVLERASSATGDIVGTRVSGMYHDFKPGAQQNTGNPLDLAIGDSESFFCVQSPQGETLYSRNGSFFLNAQNQIVTQGGYPLLGEAGPIAVPAGTARIHVATDGSVSADGNPIGRVQLNRFANLKGLTAVGPTLYSASPEAGRKTVVGTVIQGSRESSNVNPAEAMVQLIIGARYYDAAQRALRSIAETIQLNTRPQG